MNHENGKPNVMLGYKNFGKVKYLQEILREVVLFQLLQQGPQDCIKQINATK